MRWNNRQILLSL